MKCLLYPLHYLPNQYSNVINIVPILHLHLMILQEKMQQCGTHGTVKTTSETKSVQQIANSVRTKPRKKSNSHTLEAPQIEKSEAKAIFANK